MLACTKMSAPDTRLQVAVLVNVVELDSMTTPIRWFQLQRARDSLMCINSLHLSEVQIRLAFR